MKKIVLAVLVLSFIVLAGGGVFAQDKPAADNLSEQKIAVVDLKKLFNGYDQTQVKKKELEAALDLEKKQAEDKKKKIENLYKTYQMQSAMYSEEKRKEEEKKIMDEKAGYEKFAQEVVNKLQIKEQQFTEDILIQIIDRVKAIGKDEGYKYIFDNKSLLFGGEDITDKILKKINDKK